MRWFYTNEDKLVKLECINSKTAKHILRLSANNKFVNEDEDRGNIRYITIFVNNYPNIRELKDILLSLQAKYDNSNEVNSFILDGKQVWLDKATRVGLMNVLTLEKNLGKTNTTLWFKNTKIEIEIDKAITLLTAVEMYAKECYDNTQKHLKEISNLALIDECLNYDITAGYPDMLNIELT